MSDITRPMALDAGFDPRSDVFNRLLKNRVIMLGTDVNDDIANQICAQLLYLEGEDATPTSGCTSTAPAVRSRPAWPSTTPCSSSAATSPPCAWAWPPRWASSCSPPAPPASATRCPTPAIMMHQPLAGLRGQATDIAIQAEQLAYTKRRMAELIAHHSGQPLETDPGRQRARPLVHRRGGQGLRPGRHGQVHARRTARLTPAELTACRRPVATSGWHRWWSGCPSVDRRTALRCSRVIVDARVLLTTVAMSATFCTDAGSPGSTVCRGLDIGGHRLPLLLDRQRGDRSDRLVELEVSSMSAGVGDGRRVRARSRLVADRRAVAGHRCAGRRRRPHTPARAQHIDASE